MTAVALYLTHPEVDIDPTKPVPKWRLSTLGFSRGLGLARSGALQGFGPFFCSNEVKSIETAEILASHVGQGVFRRSDLGEVDRSATGYLEAAAFEAHRKALFAAPDHSCGGWETAHHAQARVVAATRAALAQTKGRKPVFVGHGAVGAFLKCALGGRPIDLSEDQPGTGGGHGFVFDPETWAVQSDWHRFEDLPEVLR